MKSKIIKKRRGRPGFNPRQSVRDLVMTCTAAHMTAQQIADALGISLRLVFDRFRRELDCGRAVRIAEILALLRKEALKRNVSAMRCLSQLYVDPAEHYGRTQLGKKERARLRAFFAEVGGLLSYGSELGDNFRRAATYADRILKGAKPSKLPVQAPIKFELMINLKTAKALGLDVPSHLQQRADEVIE